EPKLPTTGWASGRTLLREREEVSRVRGDGPVPVRDPGVRRLDHEVLVRRVRSAAVTETEVSGGEAQRLAGEDVPRIAAGDARHDRGLDARAAQHAPLSLDERRFAARRDFAVSSLSRRAASSSIFFCSAVAGRASRPKPSIAGSPSASTSVARAWTR